MNQKKRIDLKASHSYWDVKRKGHRCWAGISGSVTIVLSLVILAFIFYGDIPKEFLNQSWVEIQLWKVFSAFGVASLAIWMIRISAKIFISHLHLKTDAEERVTMMNTYLALTAEGKALPDEQRDIILQVLFRPSSTGYIKEDNTPLDSFTRIIEKNRATH